MFPWPNTVPAKSSDRLLAPIANVMLPIVRKMRVLILIIARIMFVPAAPMCLELLDDDVVS